MIDFGSQVTTELAWTLWNEPEKEKLYYKLFDLIVVAIILVIIMIILLMGRGGEDGGSQ